MALQLKNAGVRLVTIRQEFSISGASRFIRDVASALQETGKGESLAQMTETACQSIISRIHAAAGKTPKVVFIYARGAGTMSVAGKGSNMDAIIQLAGGKNAIGEFSDFKPYSTEALIKANPDIILMFDFGAGSLGGRSSILKMPGVMLTTAGKQDRIVEVDAQLMVNFSTRLPEAIKDLNARLFGS
jgi:iron complex transport system substrate-binding protein